ncbi:MAG TPA: IS701 family transposase [Solirubrobacteraceae bacterium]|nr:IS701 family transposase [Solirubrobacteraceae bacterium]
METAGVAVDGPGSVRERLEAFADEVLAQAVNRPVQLVNGRAYLRGLIGDGARKSLEPMVARLGGEADYESLQNFLAVSTWDPALVVRAVAERVAARIDTQAWVLDDTGFPKDGKHSPGVKRQYSGTLGKIGNCQIGVSVHAVGSNGTVPLGWALYLPEEWCEDAERRRKAKIPPEVEFKTKSELGKELIERAGGWDIARAPILGDEAYGKNTQLRQELDTAGFQYVFSIDKTASVFAPDTVFSLPRRAGKTGRGRTRLRPDREPESVQELVARLAPQGLQTVTFRDGPDGKPVTSQFALLRVRALKRWENGAEQEPREEWLICEWPEGHNEPLDYWISNLPADTPPEHLARLARMRWKIELDYKQLKGELGLDHYEGRSWFGWYHHTALVTAAHGFLTLERLNPKAQRPA